VPPVEGTPETLDTLGTHVVELALQGGDPPGYPVAVVKPVPNLVVAVATEPEMTPPTELGAAE
jgi:hypothetical protein